MKTFNVYEKKTMMYVGTITISIADVRKYEKDFDDFKKSDIFEDETQVFQWLLECASKLTWPMHAKDLAEQALRDWYPMCKDWKAPDLEEWSTEHWHPNYR